MLSGTALVEDFIPGHPGAISSVLENVGSGTAPAQQIAGGWQMMMLPGWEGRGAEAWQAFTPKEVDHMNAAAPAFKRVTNAMLRYQTAFQTARSEAQAAIDAARAAGHATADARQKHQDATRKAATADPGTPDAMVAPFLDPGSAALANAQSQLDVARSTLNRIGEEVAAEIRAAASITSGISPALNGGRSHIVPAIGLPPSALPEPNNDAFDAIGDFLIGFFGAAWDTVVGVVQLAWWLSTPRYLGLLFSGPEGWEKEAQAWLPFFQDPLGVSGQVLTGVWNDLIAADLWEDHPAQASGRVTFEALSLLLPFLKISKFGKLGGVAKAAPSTVDNFLPGLPKDAPPLLGRGPSQGRIVPKNLTEQLAMTEARTHPDVGKVLPITLKDTRWPASEGWVKMQQVVNGVTIHYVRNTKTGEIDDFKFPE